MQNIFSKNWKDILGSKKLNFSFFFYEEKSTIDTSRGGGEAKLNLATINDSCSEQKHSCLSTPFLDVCEKSVRAIFVSRILLLKLFFHSRNIRVLLYSLTCGCIYKRK